MDKHDQERERERGDSLAGWNWSRVSNLANQASFFNRVYLRVRIRNASCQ